MTLTIRLFARVRELIGNESCTVEVPMGATVAEVREALGHRYLQAADLIARSAIALNCEFATDDRVIDRDDEIAVIPPVSGGAE